MFEYFFEDFVFGDSFEGDEVVEVFGDVFNFVKGYSFYPALFVDGFGLFVDFEDELLSGFVFLFVLFFHFL